MLFSNSRKRPPIVPSVTTLEGHNMEVVHMYKYLWIITEDDLTFTQHIEKLVMRLKIKLAFYF